MTMTNEILVAGSCLSIVVLFGVTAYILHRKFSKVDQSLHFFLTARNTLPWYKVAGGFYAASIGAAVLFAAPSIVADIQNPGGYISLIVYAVASGLPFIVIAYCGVYIKNRFPDGTSIGSFARWRFGPFFELWVTINVLLTLGILLAVEYTAIGSIYYRFLGIEPWIPISIIATVTMIYTGLGGLSISLITDQIQSIFIVLLLGIVGVFVATHFDTTLPPLPDYLGVTDIGRGSILTFGISTFSSTMFSDAIWQRVWAAESDQALFTGAYCGGFLVTLVTLIFGFGGYLAAWAGLVTDPNLAFLELLKTGTPPIIPLSMLMTICLIATLMNEAAVDSYQIAIGDCMLSLSESFGYKPSIKSLRILLVLINIPFALIGCFDLKVISLYLMSYLMATCLIIPLMMGMIPALDSIITGSSALFGSFFGLFCIFAYGICDTYRGEWNWLDVTHGVYKTFYGHINWPPFFVGLVGSLMGMIIYSSIEVGLFRYRLDLDVCKLENSPLLHEDDLGHN
ncbi:hypothetical protein BC833DRAFT_583162 [Globomyces pollinis-pini]|nr:hypothetical protein BC833DRAFT_583162 [Globomyces pollinis-pini]